MNLWVSPQQRHYTHELPYLGGKAIKRLVTLSDTGWRWVSSQGRSIELYPVVTEHNFRTCRARVKTGRELLITLSTTATHFNGRRWWFVCPYCEERQGKLYWSDADVACRKCFRLHYASQSQDRLGRLRLKIWRKRAAIWGDYAPAYNLFNNAAYFPKPDNMRWSTFENQLQRLLNLEASYWGPLAKKLGIDD